MGDTRGTEITSLRFRRPKETNRIRADRDHISDSKYGGPGEHGRVLEQALVPGRTGEAADRQTVSLCHYFMTSLYRHVTSPCVIARCVACRHTFCE